MTSIEVFILIILLLLAVPDFCARLHRPALLYTVYLTVGMAIGPYLTPDVSSLLHQVGRFGFILLLFEIGLEIDLPPVKTLLTPAKLAFKWTAIQFPAVLGIARWIGLSWSESVLAAAALNSCSVSMTFLAWQHFPAPHQENKMHLLMWMVSIEIAAIIVLTAGYTLLSHGIGAKFFLQLALIAALVVAISRFADRLTAFVGRRLASTVRLKGHYIALFIFLVSALGARLGLSESKTAFFLGLFITRSTHEGMALNHHLRPISQHLLIPVFFVSLGASVPVALFASKLGLYALLTALFLLVLRDILHRTLVKSGCGRSAFLLVCPNLTIAALAANAMIEYGSKPESVAWIILTGLIMSVAALLLLPGRPRPKHIKNLPPQPNADSAGTASPPRDGVGAGPSVSS